MIRLVGEAGDYSERLQAAIVLYANGDDDRLRHILRSTTRDWRDTLVWAGLGRDDWPNRLNSELGEPTD